MKKFTVLPTLATSAALLFAASSASAGGNPPIVNCLNTACFTLQPGAADSDNDGFTDADEKAYGSDPFDASSRPSMPWLIENLGNGTLPSYWLVPQIDLITVTPATKATASLPALESATQPTSSAPTQFKPTSLSRRMASPSAESSRSLRARAPRTRQGPRSSMPTERRSAREWVPARQPQRPKGMQRMPPRTDAKAAADEKAAAEAKAKAEQEAKDKQDAGRHTDPDADQGVDPGTLSSDPGPGRPGRPRVRPQPARHPGHVLR